MLSPVSTLGALRPRAVFERELLRWPLPTWISVWHARTHRALRRAACHRVGLPSESARSTPRLHAQSCFCGSTTLLRLLHPHWPRHGPAPVAETRRGDRI